MRNMRMPKISAAFFIACGLLILPGCRSPLERPDASGNGPAGTDARTGTLSLTIQSQGLGRTILPEISLGDFVRFELEFVPCGRCLAGNTAPETIGWERDCITEGSGTVKLPVGIWNVHVTAFTEGGEGSPDIDMAWGSLAGIEISSRETAAGNIVLSPIARGTGIFSWVIDFDEENIAAAGMEITLVDGNGETRWGTFSFVGGSGIRATNPGSLVLPAGQYRVVFTVYNTQGDRAVLNTVLHVYRNMESVFDEEFTDDHFRVSLSDTVLDAWDGSRWDFAGNGIRAVHFSALGIGGVSDGNFAVVVGWLDSLSSPDLLPGDLHGLRVLVDAALVGMASTDANFLGTVHDSWDGVQGAIAGFVRNGTAVMFGGWTGDNTVYVNVGVYRVEFAFASLPAIPVSGATLAEQLAWLRDGNAVNNSWHFIGISADESIGPQELAFDGMTVCIILRGNGVVTLADNGSLFTVGSGVTLRLDGDITLRGMNANDAPLVLVGPDGTFVMERGTVTGNTNTCPDYTGGGMRVYGTFAMNGGVISHNAASSIDYWVGGGGVMVDGGAFVMNGGSVLNNSAVSGGWSDGGGVFVRGEGTFVMNNGTISHNISRQGGGVSLGAGGTFTMHNGTISYNNTTDQQWASGGGVMIVQGSTFNMHGGAIRANASLGGGGIAIGWYGGVDGVGGIFNMHGGTISENTAQRDGGGVLVSGESLDGVSIQGIFDMRGGVIFGNTAVQGGGGVAGSGIIRMSNGVIYGSDAALNLQNTAYWGAALGFWGLGIAQFGTFVGDVFTPLADLSITNHTIDMGNIVIITVTDIPSRYHGSSGDIRLMYSETLVRTWNSMVAITSFSATVVLISVAPGTYYVYLRIIEGPTNIVMRYSASVRTITSNTIIPWDAFTLVERGMFVSVTGIPEQYHSNDGDDWGMIELWVGDNIIYRNTGWMTSPATFLLWFPYWYIGGIYNVVLWFNNWEGRYILSSKYLYPGISIPFDLFTLAPSPWAFSENLERSERTMPDRSLARLPGTR